MSLFVLHPERHSFPEKRSSNADIGAHLKSQWQHFQNEYMWKMLFSQIGMNMCNVDMNELGEIVPIKGEREYGN
jgi:hypothetical protein